MPNRRAVLRALGGGATALSGCLGTLGGTETCAEDGQLSRVDGEWPTRGRTAGHVGAIDAGGFDAAPSVRWCVEADGRWTSLVLADGTLFAIERVSEDGQRSYYLQARDATDGSREWRVRLPVEPIAEPAVADGGVHLTMEGDDGTLAARYAASDGRREWRVETTERTDSMPAVADVASGAGGSSDSSDGGTMFVTDVSGGLHAREAATGTHRWSTELSDRLDPASRGNVPAVVDGTVYVDAAIGEGPAAVDAATGAVTWQRDVHHVLNPVTDGDVLLGGDQELHALDAATGRTRWTVQRAVDGVAPVVLDGDRVFVTFEDGLEARAGDGSRLWSVDVQETPGTPLDLVGTDGTLLYAGPEGMVGYDSASGNEQWTADVSANSLVAARGVAFSFYGGELRGLAFDGG